MNEVMLSPAEPRQGVKEKGAPVRAPRKALAVCGERVSTRRPVARLLLFFCLLLSSFIVLDRTFTFGLRRIKTSEFGAINQALSGTVNARIVISGSSRAVVQYDPRIIQDITQRSAFNLGRNGVQTDLQVAFLKAYLKHNRKPDLLIHNLDLYTFVLAREVYDPGKFLPYLNEPELYEPLRKINPDVWKWKYFPLYGYAVEDMRFTWLQALPALLGFNPRENWFLGYNPRNVKWTGDFDSFQAAHQAGVKIEIQPEAVHCLEDLLATCREQGIHVILVYSPEYSEMQSLTLNRAELFGKFREIADKFNVPLWDYSESALCRNRDLFYNSQHLNRTGSALFSEDLARRLKAFTFANIPALPGRLSASR
jgi:hypothetical protein